MSHTSGRVAPRRLLSRLAQATALAAAVVAGMPAAAALPVLTATQLNVYRDGTSADWLQGNSRLLADGFDNGDPLVGPAFATTGQPATYVLLGLAAGADASLAAQEKNSTLMLDPSYAQVTSNAAGLSGQSLRLRLQTNISTPNAGLNVSRSFAATLRLSLDALPAAGQSFGLRLSDGGISTSNDDVIELYATQIGGVERLLMRRQDFDNNTVTVLGNVALTPVAGASTVVLSISHSTAGSDQVFGNYAYSDATGALLTPFTSLGSSTAFHGEDYTRVELRATQAVPEPASWALMAGGLLLLGHLRSRRSR